MTNKQLIEKADLALSELTTGGGNLAPAVAQRFLKLLIQESTLMKMATVTPMRAPQQRIPKIGMSSRVLRPGTPKVAVDNPDHRAAPDLNFVQMDAQLFRGEVQIPDEVFEDNVEQGRLQSLLIEMVAMAVARDMEEIIIQSDTDVANPAHPNLNILDGILKQATSHTVDFISGGNPARVSFDKLSEMLRAVPGPYRRLRDKMAFFTSFNCEDDYRKLIQARETQAGDRNLQESDRVRYHGTQIVPVGLFPEALGDGSNETEILLTDPKNIYVGIWRDVRIELDRDVRHGFVSIVPTVRFDVKLAVEDAVVKGINVLNS